jgi:hypothetical protein
MEREKDKSKCTVYTLGAIGGRKMYKVQGGGSKIEKHES